MAITKVTMEKDIKTISLFLIFLCFSSLVVKVDFAIMIIELVIAIISHITGLSRKFICYFIMILKKENQISIVH